MSNVHSGSVEADGVTLSDAIEHADKIIQLYVGDRRYRMRTRSSPSQKAMNGDVLMWRVDVEWEVIS